MKVISISQFACRDVRELSDAYLDDELLAETSLYVLRHLVWCKSCGRVFQRKSGLKNRLRSSVKTTRVPPGLAMEVQTIWRTYRQFS
jgi:predicted anti-sigma-YlaC factor YlaD